MPEVYNQQSKTRKKDKTMTSSRAACKEANADVIEDKDDESTK